jgi:cysteine-rich repeat protein
VFLVGSVTDLGRVSPLCARVDITSNPTWRDCTVPAFPDASVLDAAVFQDDSSVLLIGNSSQSIVFRLAANGSTIGIVPGNFDSAVIAGETFSAFALTPTPAPTVSFLNNGSIVTKNMVVPFPNPVSFSRIAYDPLTSRVYTSAVLERGAISTVAMMPSGRLDADFARSEMAKVSSGTGDLILTESNVGADGTVLRLWRNESTIRVEQLYPSGSTVWSNLYSLSTYSVKGVTNVAGATFIAAAVGDRLWYTSLLKNGTPDAVVESNADRFRTSASAGTVAVQHILQAYTFTYIGVALQANNESRAGIWKLYSNGIQHPNFASNGFLLLPNPVGFAQVKIANILVLGNRSPFIYVSGNAMSGNSSYCFVTRVFADNGSLDTAWASGFGFATYIPPNSVSCEANKLFWGAGDSLVLVSSATQPNSTAFVVTLRLNPDTGACRCNNSCFVAQFRSNGALADSTTLEDTIVVATSTQRQVHLRAITASNMFACPLTCGNGFLDLGEECDDGNSLSGDGCSSACRIEAGATCPFIGFKCNTS